MMTQETDTTIPRCEARIGVTPGAFGFEPKPCNATRGLRSFVDAQDRTHWFCPASGHGESVAISNGAILQFTRKFRPMYEGMD